MYYILHPERWSMNEDWSLKDEINKQWWINQNKQISAEFNEADQIDANCIAHYDFGITIFHVKM